MIGSSLKNFAEGIH